MSTSIPVKIETIKLACMNARKILAINKKNRIEAAKEKAMHGFWNYLRFRRDKAKIASYYEALYGNTYNFGLRELEAITRVSSADVVNLEMFYVEWVDQYLADVG